MTEQEPRGVLVAPELCAWLYRAAIEMVNSEERRNGGGGILPRGLAELFAELRTAASGRLPGRIGTVDPTPVTVTSAAQLAGVSPRHIRRLAAEGKIRARRHGRDWLIDPQGAREWPARRRRQEG
jgi:excisionase family DNA binding protein